MNRKPGLWAFLLALAVMIGLSAWAAPNLPDRVPVHWGIDGTADRYGSRLEALIAMPLVTLGLGLLFAVLPSVEPRRRHLEESARAYNAVWIMALLALVGGHAIILLSGLGRQVPVPSIALAGVGALLLVLGNYLGKIRSNWFLGIRTPWTLSSERSWNCTHRLGGRLFAALGALILVTVLLSTTAATWVLGIGLAAVLIATVVYSYIVWRDDPDQASARA